jgi:hypothetical protein
MAAIISALVDALVTAILILSPSYVAVVSGASSGSRSDEGRALVCALG